MKKILTLLITLHLSCHVFAQSGIMLPDGFVVPNLTEAPVCTVDDKGKMYFNTSSKLILVCDGAQWKPSASQWSLGQSPQTISYNGKVGINTETPQYELDVNGNARISSFLFAVGGIGIGATTLPSGLMVTDGDIAITSTVDTKTWKFDYSDANDHLALKEDGATRMIFANGGNVGIGSTPPTAKLSVDGNGSFSGNLTVNGGKGIVRTTTAAAYKVHVAQFNLGASFSVLAGNCATNSPALNITSAGFTSAPTAQLGNVVSGTGNFGKLIINIDSANANAVVVRFCNNTTSNITLSNMVFNVLCIGL
ncbi:hypothetical protein [Emticicia sp. BO119]|uniref:hypothetical protein n=1 Tax=Emticicia sp. BO119 TaxID=2757768 RepID=UPI0015F0C1F6|nr:hypothetical protein [Emticicia sp. BO119]MBA4853965.1 hypothetical protein [Emticicia sp. BO119]